MSPADVLVQDYLGRLDRAAAPLPPERRSELVTEIGEHVAAARADGAGDDEAAVRTVLDRLGSPEEIVASAYDGGGPPAGAGPAPWGAPAQRPGTGLETAAVVLLTAGSLVPFVGWLAGVALLWASSLWRVREKLLGTLVVPFGPGGAFFFGALLPLGRSEVCTSGPVVDAGVGAAPGAPPAPGAVPAPPPGPPPPGAPPGPPDGSASYSGSCVVTGPPEWVGPVVVALLVLAPVVVAVVLLRLARRRAEQAAAVPGPGGWPPLGSPGAAVTPWGPLEIGAVAVLALGGLLVPLVGAVVGFVLACCSPRWTVRDKVVAGALVLVPTVLPLSALLVGRLAL